MRRNGWTTWVRRLGVTLLILNLAHVPLPLADFHVIGHLHGVGQICPLHDHLLRWHASEGASENPVLHFHWAFLSEPVPDTATEGPAFHADVADPLDAKLSDLLPESAVAASMRSMVERPSPALLVGLHLEPSPGGTHHAVSAGSAPAFRNFAATFPPHLPTASRLQRWVC
jgi:hypothetical protein